MRRALLSVVLFANRKLKRLAVHLTHWTGKAREPVHPKHLLGEDVEQYWYLPYITPRDIVLDVGCGHGMHALKAAAVAEWVRGIDRDTNAIATAMRLRDAAGMDNVGFGVENIEAAPLPFPSGHFTVVLCLDVLEHVHHRVHCLQEIRRVMTADGWLLLSVPHSGTTWKRRLERAGICSFSDPDHKVEYTLASLNEELRRAGFLAMELHPSVRDTPWIGLIDVIGGCSLSLYRRITAWRRRHLGPQSIEAAGFSVACRRMS